MCFPQYSLGPKVHVPMPCFQQQGSQDSLDRRASLPRIKSFDAVVFDVLRVSAEDFAVSTSYCRVLSNAYYA